MAFLPRLSALDKPEGPARLSLLPDAGGDALGRILGGRQSAVGLLLRSDPLAQTGSVRRSARSISTLLISSCLLVATCGSASADFSASDPDDVDGMDIRHVATDVTGGLIKFTASFYDIIRWGRGATTIFEIDSRGGRRADRFIKIRWRHAFRCYVLNPHSTVIDQHRAFVGSNHASCWVRRAILDPDGSAIRWRARANYRKEPGPSSDESPGVGWFPHV